MMVKSLKAKKLLAQRSGTDDTRVRHLALTTAGIAVLAKATPLMGALQERLWPPGTETETLLALMKATAHRWTTDEADWSGLPDTP
jgi:DNA-binding MarR family transcriptional regulator